MVRPWRQAAGSTRTSDRHPSPPFPFPIPPIPVPIPLSQPPFPIPPIPVPTSPIPFSCRLARRRSPTTRGSARADPGPCTPKGPAGRTYKYTDLHAEIQPEKQTEAARSSSPVFSSSPVYCFHCTQYYQPLFCLLSNIILKQTILLAIVMLIVEYCSEAKQYCLSLFYLFLIIVFKQTILFVIVNHCVRANLIVDYIVDCYLCIVDHCFITAFLFETVQTHGDGQS